MEKYNGWKNYPTWAVNLWLENERGSYEYLREMAEEAKENNPDDKDAQRWELADNIQNYVTELLPEIEGMGADLMEWALSYVDWNEIAVAVLEDE